MSLDINRLAPITQRSTRSGPTPTSFHGVNMGQHDLSDIWDWDMLAPITPGVLDNNVIQI